MNGMPSLSRFLATASPAGPATGLTGNWSLDAENFFYVNRTEADLAAGAGKAVYDMPFDDYRALGFPGAEDMGNMYQWQAIAGQEFLDLRSADTARALNPELLELLDQVVAQ